MVNPTPGQPPSQTASTPSSEDAYVAPTPTRCLIGAIISGGLGAALYFLTAAIAETFAAKPIPSNNAIAMNIAVAVRTLVIGSSALATAVFGIACLGLLALSIQLFVKEFYGDRQN